MFDLPSLMIKLGGGENLQRIGVEPEAELCYINNWSWIGVAH